MNKDEEIHMVTSSQGLFRSPGLEGDQQFAHRFEKPGTYEYGCALHPQMKGTIVVR
jgi:plastocyanin